MEEVKSDVIPQTDTVPLQSSRNEFLKEEYASLRSEVISRLESLWTLEKFGFGGAAAIAAWIMTHKVTTDAAWWLPFLFLLVCCVRFGSGMYHLGFRINKYVSNTEKTFLGEEGGWETWFGKQAINETIAYSLAWIVALIIALTFAIVVPRIDNQDTKVDMDSLSASPHYRHYPFEQEGSTILTHRLHSIHISPDRRYIVLPGTIPACN
jgi:FtsH-binding integral membrane protein